MKILAKMKRRNNGDDLPKRGHYVEMDLFDTDRNPLTIPSSSRTIIRTKTGQIPVPYDSTVPPWRPFPWSRRIGLPINDSDGELVVAPTETTDPAVKLVQSGSFLIGMRANMNLDWTGESGAFTYNLYARLWVFKYSSSGAPYDETLGWDTITIPFDTAAGGQSIVLQTIWQADLNEGDEIGAELRLDSSIGPPAGGDPWFYPEAPIVGSLTRLGDYV